MTSLGRPLKYLRISITDRCNLRCRYCMPETGVVDQSHSKTLTYEAYLKIVAVMVELGVTKVRVTGGEPLVRKGCVDFIRALSQTQGIEEVVMTTNGLLLATHARALKEAGLSRVNISLDALDESVFSHITRCGHVSGVLEGIRAAKEAGLTPIKLNMVYMDGINHMELAPMMGLTGPQVQLRLIELMPIGEAAQWARHHFASVNHVLDNHPLLSRAKDLDSGVSKNYIHAETGGIVGGITPISDHFCNSCDKVRLTSDGHLKVCLHDDYEVDLKPYLDQPDPAPLKEAIIRALMEKSAGHHLAELEAKPVTRNMVSVGG